MRLILCMEPTLMLSFFSDINLINILRMIYFVNVFFEL